MRILLLLILFFPLTSNAECFLTEEKHVNRGNYVIYKISGGRPAPEVICSVPCRKNQRGSDYDIKIVEKDAEGNIISERSWTEDATLSPDEQVECSINSTRRQARLDQRAQEEQTRQARQAKVRKLTEDFKRECIQEFSKKRGRSQEFNTCLAALFKKVFGEFDELPEDALKFNSSN